MRAGRFREHCSIVVQDRNNDGISEWILSRIEVGKPTCVWYMGPGREWLRGSISKTIYLFLHHNQII